VGRDWGGPVSARWGPGPPLPGRPRRPWTARLPIQSIASTVARNPLSAVINRPRSRVRRLASSPQAYPWPHWFERLARLGHEALGLKLSSDLAQATMFLPGQFFRSLHDVRIALEHRFAAAALAGLGLFAVSSSLQLLNYFLAQNSRFLAKGWRIAIEKPPPERPAGWS
jgi:hypothetical protein